MSYGNISQPGVDCLTCSNVSQVPACLYASVVLSPDYRSYILNCLGPNIPYTAVFSLPSNQVLTVLETNQHIKQKLAEKDLPFTQLLEVRQAGGGGEEGGVTRVKLLVPPAVVEKEGETTGLVLLLDQEVSARWTCGLAWLVVGEAGYATALVEPATLAQLEEVVALLSRLQWVDPARVGVFGVGQGGHSALSLLLANTRALSTVHCGAVQAPVTDWALGRHHNTDLI